MTHAPARLMAIVAAVGVLAGCVDPGSQQVSARDPARTPHAARADVSPSLSPSTSPAAGLPAGSSLVATARPALVEVHDSPDGVLAWRLPNPNHRGAPLTFLVVARRSDWTQVLLPLRPNGSTGWVRTSQVTLTTTPYRLVVHRTSHRLEVSKGGVLVATHPIGVGTAVTPTPAGHYYLTELLAQPHPGGPYGPYAFGLSAFSETLTSFAGGPGQLGLHGTNHPEAVGTDVSHGCLRVTNEVITSLAAQLPLGTPVDITA